MSGLRIHPKDMMVVLTGAGVSAESGISTFRDADGLWERYDIEEVATPAGWHKNPKLVWRFYNDRLKDLASVNPNPAHEALAEIERRMPEGQFVLVTQNVDDLHEKAGSRNLIHMHGELRKARCESCSQVVSEWDTDAEIPSCSSCGQRLRPHVVWFGELPFQLQRIFMCLEQCTVFLGVGTSGFVNPAASFVASAKSVGARTAFVNLEHVPQTGFIDHFYQGKAGELLPGLLREWLDA